MLKLPVEFACIFGVSADMFILNIPVERTVMLLNIAFPPIAFTVVVPPSNNPEKLAVSFTSFNEILCPPGLLIELSRLLF